MVYKARAKYQEENKQAIKDFHARYRAKAILEMSQYDATLPSNLPKFKPWEFLSDEELKDIFRKEKVLKHMQKGFEYWK